MENTIPVLDNNFIQEKANEYALKGAVECIKNYYTGYDSPYKKAIEAELSKNSNLDGALSLPNIMGLINESLSKEIDAIVNTAISKTYVEKISKFFTKVDKEIKMSDILEEFVKAYDIDDIDDCEIEINDNKKYDWKDLVLSYRTKNYYGDYKKSFKISLTLHKKSFYSAEEKEKYKDKVVYTIYSLPFDIDNPTKEVMKLSHKDGYDETYTIELPFKRDILKDDFICYIANVVMNKSEITIDTDSFDEDMFPKRCHCDD